MIAACDNGLLALDTGGSFKYKLSDDSFTDVCTNGEKIFAIKNRICEVQVYGLIKKQWMMETEFPVKDEISATKHCM